MNKIYLLMAGCSPVFAYTNLELADKALELLRASRDDVHLEEMSLDVAPQSIVTNLVRAKMEDLEAGAAIVQAEAVIMTKRQCLSVVAESERDGYVTGFGVSKADAIESMLVRAGIAKSAHATVVRLPPCATAACVAAVA